MTEQERNKQTYREVIDKVFNHGETEAVDQGIDHGYKRAAPDVNAHGTQAVKDLVMRFRAALRGLHYHVDELIAEGDHVAARWTVTGVHAGKLFGVAPTGRELHIHGMSFNRYKDGKSIEAWINYNVHDLLVQMGAAEPIEF